MKKAKTIVKDPKMGERNLPEVISSIVG